MRTLIAANFKFLELFLYRPGLSVAFGQIVFWVLSRYRVIIWSAKALGASVLKLILFYC
jgi:hypothetical protein